VADRVTTFLDARDLLRRYHLHPKRSFSQNFLVQPTAVAAIADTAAGFGEEVVELGPGLGALTGGLLDRGCEVTAVELDRDMVRVLTEELKGEPRVHIVLGDAAAFDYRAHAAKRGRSLTVVGNLPYQATGAILRQVVAHRDAIAGAVLMLQREVRDRLVADPGRKDYGALTVFVQAAFEVDTILRLKPGSFYPPPQVESAVVRLTPRSAPLADESEAFRAVVRAAFQARRKTLRNALRQIDGELRAEAALREASIDPNRRGETLSVKEFADLADAWGRSG